MDYISALQILHSNLKPHTYFEIGCRFGHSLALSRCPSIVVDPDPQIRASISQAYELYKKTSDAFFQSEDIQSILKNGIDLAFIDGMHRVENVLRDFMNLEKWGHKGTVIVIDDILPGDMRYATRERETQIWCGDVYRIIKILRTFRPDLTLYPIDIEMKGLCIVSNLDPSNSVLRENYSEIFDKIGQGDYCENSVADIRKTIQPIPASQMPRIAEELRTFRAHLS